MSFLDTTLFSPSRIRRALRANKDTKTLSKQAIDFLRQKSNRLKGFKNRFSKIKDTAEFVARLRFELNLLSLAESDNSDFKFEEIKLKKVRGKVKFPTGKWHLHGSAIPDRVFRVHKKIDGQWTMLGACIGCSMHRGKLSRMFGHSDHFRQVLKGCIKKGKVLIYAVVSGYVEDQNDPHMRAGRRKNLRGQIESAFIEYLLNSGCGLVQSSILFNCRKEPITGLRVGLINVFTKFPIILLPTYYNLQEERRKLVNRLRAKFDLKKYPGKNATIWIAYVNKDIIKLNRLPKFDLSSLTRPEDALAGAENSFQAIKTYYTRVVNLIRYTWGQSDQLEMPDYTQKILTRGAATQQKRKERRKELKKQHPVYSNVAQDERVKQASTARISEYLENTAKVQLTPAKPSCDIINNLVAKKFQTNHLAPS